VNHRFVIWLRARRSSFSRRARTSVRKPDASLACAGTPGEPLGDGGRAGPALLVAEKAPVALTERSRIGTQVVLLSQRPADALSGLWLVGEAQQHVHVRVRGGLPACAIAVPADVETVRPVALVEQGPRVAQELKR
jgi:hypothetical protein